MSTARADEHPFLDHPRPLAIAHRGGDEVAPENTIAAFRSAFDTGFRYLETDVHVTSDGVLVAFHDDRLDRVTDRHGAIADLRWSDVREARIGGERIPRFEELLEEFPAARINVDMKSEHSVIALVRAIRRQQAAERVCIASFSTTRLRRARALLGPEVCSAAGPKEISALVAGTRLPARMPRRSAVPPFGCLQVPVRHAGVEVVTPALLRRVRALGCQVHVWTIDEPAEMHRLLDLGVDGIMTDKPSVLRSVLESRGEWVDPG